MDHPIAAYREVAPGTYPEAAGLSLENFVVGDTFEHRPGRTITDTDTIWMTLAHPHYRDWLTEHALNDATTHHYPTYRGLRVRHGPFPSRSAPGRALIGRRRAPKHPIVTDHQTPTRTQKHL